MRLYLFAAVIIFLNACNNHPVPEPKPQSNAADTTVEKPDFFPVTSFLKGQIYNINQKGLAPLKYTTVNHTTDSVFVKLEQLDSLLTEFLHPEIDSLNMVPFFTETKFLDQTVDAFTFTYDPKAKLPDSIHLKHWDVYIDPETSEVKRVYMIKEYGSTKTLQLTWQSNLWCKIVTLSHKPDGSSTVEKEEKISWDY
ncbi:hypothetical protein [Ferruginibacter sp. SUN106]|uniref:hypothetical protein n=1 Tax=Ferruginibacter sp. SUN106 TaxID=2978348 RepID=UPI003D36E527